MTGVRIAVEMLAHAEGLPLPRYATPGAAGMDLLAAIPSPYTLEPGERWLCPTGLRIALPPGYEAQVRPRSGLALRHGVTCLNSPGTIDSDYRGEVGIVLANLGREPVVVERGMRVAQMVVAPVVQAEWAPAASLDATARGAGGFGHTGV